MTIASSLSLALPFHKFTCMISRRSCQQNRHTLCCLILTVVKTKKRNKWCNLVKSIETQASEDLILLCRSFQLTGLTTDTAADTEHQKQSQQSFCLHAVSCYKHVIPKQVPLLPYHVKRQTLHQIQSFRNWSLILCVVEIPFQSFPCFQVSMDRWGQSYLCNVASTLSVHG